MINPVKEEKIESAARAHIIYLFIVIHFIPIVLFNRQDLTTATMCTHALYVCVLCRSRYSYSLLHVAYVAHNL